MASIIEVSQELAKSIAEAQKTQETLDKAKAGLAPLEEAAKQAHNRVNALIGQYQNLTTDAPAWVGKRGRRAGGPPKKYVISDESKLRATGLRARTRYHNANPKATEAELNKIQKSAEKSLAEKLGLAK
jgi:hypothetical protein